MISQLDYLRQKRPAIRKKRMIEIEKSEISTLFDLVTIIISANK